MLAGAYRNSAWTPGGQGQHRAVLLSLATCGSYETLRTLNTECCHLLLRSGANFSKQLNSSFLIYKMRITECLLFITIRFT